MKLTDVFSKIFNSKPIVEKIGFSKSMMGTDEDIAMTFNVFDGLAYCEEFEGNEYVLSYPKLEFVKNCKIMLNAVKEFVGKPEEEDITITDILRSYGSLYKIESFAPQDSKEYVLNTKETEPKILHSQVGETEPKILHSQVGDNPTPTMASPHEPDYYESDVYRS
jgi:hypothetical protein